MHYLLSATPLLVCAGSHTSKINLLTQYRSQWPAWKPQFQNFSFHDAPVWCHHTVSGEQTHISRSSTWQKQELTATCKYWLLACCTWKANYLVFHICHFHCRSDRYLNHLPVTNPVLINFLTRYSDVFFSQYWFKRISTIAKGQKSKFKPRVTKSPKPKFFCARNNSDLH